MCINATSLCLGSFQLLIQVRRYCRVTRSLTAVTYRRRNTKAALSVGNCVIPYLYSSITAGTKNMGVSSNVTGAGGICLTSYAHPATGSQGRMAISELRLKKRNPTIRIDPSIQ